MKGWLHLSLICNGVLIILVALYTMRHHGRQSNELACQDVAREDGERGKRDSKYKVLLTNTTLQRWPKIQVTGREAWMSDTMASPIVLHSPPIVYCRIYRVGCSRWGRLLRKIEGFQDYLSLWPYTRRQNGLKHFLDLTPSRVEEILNSDHYFRFVLVRDPFSRLLSAWFAKRNNSISEGLPRKSFSTFAQNISGTILAEKRRSNRRVVDPHWTPISQYCGLSSIPFDFVGHYETLHEWGPLLIRRIGGEREAASGWGKKDALSFLAASKSFGSLVSDASSTSVLHRYYTPQLVDIVAEAYAEDLILFNYTAFGRKLRQDVEIYQLNNNHRESEQ